jgi:hypothetical protein
VETIRFRKDGEPVIVEVTCGHAQEGAYAILLWERDENKILMEKRGNFINTDDDAYELPKPNAGNAGRLVECICTVVITPPIDKFAVFLTFTQAGRNLGVVSASGESSEPAVTVDLFATLEMEGGD